MQKDNLTSPIDAPSEEYSQTAKASTAESDYPSVNDDSNKEIPPNLESIRSAGL